MSQFNEKGFSDKEMMQDLEAALLENTKLMVEDLEELKAPQVKTIDIQSLDLAAKLPVRAHADDAGMDLHSLEDVVLAPGAGQMIKTGVAMAVPQGHVGLICDRSSMGKKGIKVMGGVVDAGYRGEVMVVLWNLSQTELAMNAGERIAQMLILPIATPAVNEVPTLDANTARGAGGFGSTGK